LFFPDVAASAAVIAFSCYKPLSMMRPVRGQRINGYSGSFPKINGQTLSTAYADFAVL
jgi:hypothetical protein